MEHKYYALDEIEFSEDVDEIIGKPPAWIIQRGTSLIILIVVIVSIGAATIKYPDVVKGKLVIQPKPFRYELIGTTKSLNFDEVKIGQKAIIKLRGYPSDKYGYLEGEIVDILNQTDSSTSFKMNVPNGLVTNRGVKISSKIKYIGEVDIICNNRTVLSRIFSKNE